MKVVHPGLAWETVGCPPSATQAGAPNEHPQECAVDAARSTPVGRAHHRGRLEYRADGAGRGDLGAPELSLAGALSRRGHSRFGRPQLGAALLPAPYSWRPRERNRAVAAAADERAANRPPARHAGVYGWRSSAPAGSEPAGGA